MLDVLHVSKKINGRLVINNCSFTTKENSIFGIVGVNGVGKSTLLKLCSGLLKPDEGVILLGTETIYNNLNVKKDVVFIPDNIYFEPGSTIKLVKKFYEAFYTINENYFNYLLDRFELKLTDVLSNLSKGKYKRVFLAIGLAICPRLLLLDETFDGLDPICKRIFKEEARKLADKHKSNIILTSHSLRELSSLADEIGYLEDGKLITLNDKSYLDDMIYRVVVVKDENTKFNNIDSLYILKKEENNTSLILDIYSPIEQIKYTFKEAKFLEINNISFEDWIVYQMEVLK